MYKKLVENKKNLNQFISVRNTFKTTTTITLPSIIDPVSILAFPRCVRNSRRFVSNDSDRTLPTKYSVKPSTTPNNCLKLRQITLMVGNGTNFIGIMTNHIDVKAPTLANGSKIRKRDNRQRLSAHKVSLFLYPNVKAVSCKDGNMTKSPLLSNGPLELYQIVTPSLNNNDRGQEMNYLSLGRRGNIVHPILPRLQVKRLNANNEISFLITFYNPERYWELEFLPSNNDNEELLAAVRDFERVISSVCVYTGLEVGTEAEAEDELDYLLNESEQESDSESNPGQIFETVRSSSRETTATDEFINEAFKRAIRVMTETGDLRTTNRPRRHSTFAAWRPQRRKDDSLRKRFSYQGLPLRIASDPTN